MAGPIHPDKLDGEHLNTDEKLQAAGWAAGLDVGGQVDKAYGNYLDDDYFANAQLWSLRQAVYAEGYARAKADAAVMYGEDGVPHTAHRGSDVEAWIKRWRDAHDSDSAGWVHHVHHAIDAMLDDYRDHADTGTPLNERVIGPHGEES